MPTTGGVRRKGSNVSMMDIHHPESERGNLLSPSASIRDFVIVIVVIIALIILMVLVADIFI